MIEPVSSTVGAIVEFAEKEKVDLIMMGTRGLGGLRSSFSEASLPESSRTHTVQYSSSSERALAGFTLGLTAASIEPMTNSPKRRTMRTKRVIATYILSFSTSVHEDRSRDPGDGCRQQDDEPQLDYVHRIGVATPVGASSSGRRLELP